MSYLFHAENTKILLVLAGLGLLGYGLYHAGLWLWQHAQPWFS